MTKHQVSVAAEAFAAGVFAQAGCDVSVQYGANQPGYDLIICREKKIRKVSVKGNKDGGWVLAIGHKKINPTYSATIDAWYKEQDTETIFALVQFNHIAIGNMPRIYLATRDEVASHMKNQDNGDGAATLYEDYLKTKGKNKNFHNKIPDAWLFNESRLGKFI